MAAPRGELAFSWHHPTRSFLWLFCARGQVYFTRSDPIMPAHSGGARPGAGRKLGVLTRPTKEVFELRAAAAAQGWRALQVIIALAENAKAEAVRLAAAKELLDRGFGKTVQPYSHSGNIRFTHEQALAEIERRANAELGITAEPRFKLNS